MALFVFSIVNGQNTTRHLFEEFQNHPYRVQSPNVASIEKYGETTVSLYTGKPVINIPLYQVKDGNINFQISAGYNSAGFQPDARPGWVGSGWSILGGGVISRKVNDMPDEFVSISAITGSGIDLEQGYYYKKSLLNISNWNTVNGIKDISAGYGSADYIYDTEPDEFTFNVNGIHGKFFLDHLGKWRVQSDEYIKVEFTGTFADVAIVPTDGSVWSSSGMNPYNKYPKTFEGFTIITGDGTKYYFGYNSSAVEYSSSFFDQYTDIFIANAWHLTKIENVSGREVNFTYERDGFISQMYLRVGQVAEKVSGPGFLNTGCATTSLINPLDGFYHGMLISPVYLKTIETSSEKIEFITSVSSEMKYRQAIFDAKEDYWSDNRPFFPSGIEVYRDKFLPYLQRLPGQPDTYPECLNNLKWKKLNSIRVLSRQDLLADPVVSFQFNYINSANQRLTLGSIQEKGRDNVAKPPYVFSYQNLDNLPQYLYNRNDHWGFYNNTDAMLTDFTTYAALREPNISVAQYGIMNKITYPTGGSTLFEYEQHYYRKAVNDLRSDPLINYLDNKMAGGLRIRSIKNLDYDNTILTDKTYYYINGYNKVDPITSFPSSGVLTGQPKYYWEDFEYARSSNAPSLRISKTVFSSTSLVPGGTSDGGAHIGYSEVVEMNKDGGYTIHKFTNFDNGYPDESSLAALHVSVSSYMPYIDNSRLRGKLKSQTHFNSTGTKVQEVVNEYTLSTAFSNVRSIRVSSNYVCPGAFQILDKGSSYEFRTNPLLLTSSKERIYNAGATAYAEVIKTFTYDDYLNVKTIKTTASDGTINEIQRFYPYDFLTITSPVTTSPFLLGMKVLNLKNITAAVVEEKILVQDSETDPQMQIGGTLTQYNNLVPLVEEIYAYETAVPVSPVVPATVTNTAGVLTFTYDGHYKKQNKIEKYDDVGNVLEYKKINHESVSFIWDHYKRLSIAEVINASEQNIAYTSFEADNKGGWDFTGLNGVAGESFTGKKYYELAVGKNITSKLVDPALNYIVSYWSKAGVYTVSGSASHKTGRTIDGWTYFEHVVNLPATAVVISGEGEIDELRMYPVNAHMITRTYDPLIGITSECDPNNKVTYYEYDNFNRLIVVRNEDKNINSKYCYNYAGDVDDCGSIKYYNKEQKSVFSKTNCEPGTYPITFVYYIVDANTYSSTISAKHVEQFVINDITANGQSFANATSGCTTTVPVSCPIGMPSGVSLAGGPPFIMKYKNSAMIGLVLSLSSYTNGMTIATIPPNCRPSTSNYTFPFMVGDRKFQLLFETSGNVKIYLLEGDPIIGTFVLPIPQTIYYIIPL